MYWSCCYVIYFRNQILSSGQGGLEMSSTHHRPVRVWRFWWLKFHGYKLFEDLSADSMVRHLRYMIHGKKLQLLRFLNYLQEGEMNHSSCIQTFCNVIQEAGAQCWQNSAACCGILISLVRIYKENTFWKRALTCHDWPVKGSLQYHLLLSGMYSK
jgi:hypothetical protein